MDVRGPTERWGLWAAATLGAALLAGCRPPEPAPVAETIPPSRAAVVPPRPAPERPSRPMGPEFFDALDDLGAQVHRLEVGVEVDEREGMRRALRQLADVLEVVPGADELPTFVDAERIRADEAGLVASPAGELEATRRSLESATRALEDLARGPYAASPAVALRTKILAEYVVAMGKPGPLRARRATALLALRYAVKALRAIEDAQFLPGAGETTLP
jgi:hypothetical protein